MMKWKQVFKRYSFIAHILVAISSVGMLAIVPFVDYVPLPLAAGTTLIFAIFGIVGSFVKQQLEEDENDD